MSFLEKYMNRKMRRRFRNRAQIEGKSSKKYYTTKLNGRKRRAERDVTHQALSQQDS